MTPRPPVPPFTRETAIQKVRATEDAWNTRDPARLPAAYTPDSRWRNRDEFFSGREAIAAFLTRKWARELDYRLIKGIVGVHRQSHRGEICIRMSRRGGAVVAQPRQRDVAIRR
jgi:nuclear transport factor 2 (NTF2) superfamily protein